MREGGGEGKGGGQDGWWLSLQCRELLVYEDLVSLSHKTHLWVLLANICKQATFCETSAAARLKTLKLMVGASIDGEVGEGERKASLAASCKCMYVHAAWH